MVGVTAMTPTLPAALRVADIAAENVPDATVVWAASIPRWTRRACSRIANVDYVIRGEGEQPFAHLLDILAGQARRPRPNLRPVLSRERRPHIAPKAEPVDDLDDLPPADYDAFPVDRYIEHNGVLRSMRGISMIVSRGCPYTCTFCAVQQTMGRKWRTRSPDKVVDEIIRLRDEHGVEGVWFKDSIFNLKPKWTESSASKWWSARSVSSGRR